MRDDNETIGQEIISIMTDLSNDNYLDRLLNCHYLIHKSRIDKLDLYLKFSADEFIIVWGNGKSEEVNKTRLLSSVV